MLDYKKFHLFISELKDEIQEHLVNMIFLIETGSNYYYYKASILLLTDEHVY
jgi:hypothetical protein